MMYEVYCENWNRMWKECEYESLEECLEYINENSWELDPDEGYIVYHGDECVWGE